MHVELQLHQELVAESVHQVGGIGGAADVTDFDPRTCGLGEFDIDGLGIKTRQLVFDRAQRSQHLLPQEELGPLLRLRDRQHAARSIRHRATTGTASGAFQCG